MSRKLADNRRQAAAVDELHRIVMDAVIASHTEDRHDVGVMQLRGGLGFDLKPLPLLGINRRGEGKHLERDAPSQRDLLGLVDYAHTPAADFTDDSVFAELGEGGDRITSMDRQRRLRAVKPGRGGLDELEPGKAFAQNVGDIPVTREELGPRPGMPGVKRLEIILKGRDHAGVVAHQTSSAVEDESSQPPSARPGSKTPPDVTVRPFTFAAGSRFVFRLPEAENSEPVSVSHFIEDPPA